MPPKSTVLGDMVSAAATPVPVSGRLLPPQTRLVLSTPVEVGVKVRTRVHVAPGAIGEVHEEARLPTENPLE